MTKTIPKQKKYKEANWLSEGPLQIAKERREVKNKGEKEIYTHMNAEYPRISRRDKKVFNEQWKEVEVNNGKSSGTIEWERLEISSRKLEIPREHFT